MEVDYKEYLFLIKVRRKVTIIGIHIITWVGIVLIAVGTICTIWGQQVLTNKSATEISTKADKIEKLSEKNILLNEEVSSLAKENANLNIELRKFVSGGDSFCYIQTYFEVGYGDNLVSLSIDHKGNYPLYDVDLTIYDRTKRGNLIKATGMHKDFQPGEWVEFQKEHDLIGEFYDISQKSILIKHHFPVIAVGTKIMPFLRIKLPENQHEQEYLVKIYARNGTITQPIKFLKVDGHWQMSMRVQQYDNINHKVIELLNDLSEAVPLNDNYAGE
jgi:hypothetical protein